MQTHVCLTLLMTVFFNALLNVECKSYFGIGNRYSGDQLLLRDEVENRHYGLTEVPMVAFNYAIREPITYIEIMSDENVLADVNFSYYNTLINGTVTALSTSLKDENEPFKVLISIYGFNESTPEMYAAELLRQKLYFGPLRPTLEPGVVDHMEMTNLGTNDEIADLLDESAEEEISGEDNQINEEIAEDDDEELEYEGGEDEFDTFESMDKFIVAGKRQEGDYLLFSTYQTSPTTTEAPTNHSVTFYFIDSVYITYIEFVIIDYANNKTTDEIENSYIIEYSHYSYSTFKAIIRDYKTTSLFAKMSIFGYKPQDLPTNYVSYVPHKLRGGTFAPITTESPQMHLRTQINALQQEDYEKLPSSFNMLRHDGEFQYRVKTDDKISTNNANAMQSKITNLSVMVPLCMCFASMVYSLWRHGVNVSGFH